VPEEPIEAEPEVREEKMEVEPEQKVEVKV
jgi:hypothetical protein